MKQIILLIAVLLCLTSCGKQSEQTASNTAEAEITKAVTSQVITEITDTSTHESGDNMKNYDFSTLTMLN